MKALVKNREEEGFDLEDLAVPNPGNVEGETLTVIGYGPIGQFAVGISKIMRLLLKGVRNYAKKEREFHTIQQRSTL